MVEAAIGEAFEASLGLGPGGGAAGGAMPPSGPQRFAGGHRSVNDQSVRTTDLNCRTESPSCYISGRRARGGNTPSVICVFWRLTFCMKDAHARAVFLFPELVGNVLPSVGFMLGVGCGTRVVFAFAGT